MEKLEKDRLSRFLSLVLRHKPETIGIIPDAYGYVDIDRLMEQAKVLHYEITREALLDVVRDNDKQRFKIDLEGNKIRANQGHSIAVEPEEKPQQPPEFLYHGTKAALQGIIASEGIKSMKRNFVHTYKEYDRAFIAGNRSKKKAIVFEIDALRMYEAGFMFYLSENDVWQTSFVPAAYIRPVAMEEIYALKTVRIKKTTSFRKLTDKTVLIPYLNPSTLLYAENCFLCHSPHCVYHIDRNNVLCEELSWERNRKSHSLNGMFLRSEIRQTDSSLEFEVLVQLEIPKDYTLEMDKNTAKQSIGFRYNCPACGVADRIWNMRKPGDIDKCIQCGTALFETAGTEIAAVD